MRLKPISLVLLMLSLSACATISSDPQGQAIDHFVSLGGAPSGSDQSAGPDDQIKLSYAEQPSDQGDTLTGGASAFDLALRFGSSNMNVYRFRNPATGKVHYYDAKGEQLGQYLLRNPVPDGRKTSGFGMRRHPVLKRTRMHSGVDWAAPVGTPIYAAADGVVSFVGLRGGDGKQIVIDHGHGYQTSYSHQSKFAAGIKPGVSVQQGALIGYVGRSGLVTGPHLHYQVMVDGRAVDPMNVHFIVEDKLAGSTLARFEKQVKSDKREG